MWFFDIVMIKGISLNALSRRLGYKKMLEVGKEVEITENLEEPGRTKRIVRSDNNEVLVKSLRQNDVIGILPKNNLVSKNILETIKADEKILFVPVSLITSADETSRAQKLVNTRRIIRNALKFRTPLSLVTLAERKEDILSSVQMLELASFLGIEQKQAKEALGRLGEI